MHSLLPKQVGPVHDAEVPCGHAVVLDVLGAPHSPEVVEEARQSDVVLVGQLLQETLELIQHLLGHGLSLFRSLLKVAG